MPNELKDVMVESFTNCANPLEAAELYAEIRILAKELVTDLVCIEDINE